MESSCIQTKKGSTEGHAANSLLTMLLRHFPGSGQAPTSQASPLSGSISLLYKCNSQNDIPKCQAEYQLIVSGGKKTLNALDFGMKSWRWEPRLPTSLWGSLCCSASGLAYSWLPAVCPVDDIAFIQIFHPQDTTLQQDHNHPSNTLGQCVEQLFRVLGDVDQSLKKIL